MKGKKNVPMCNARKVKGDGTCRHEAGWGTDHPGIGRCRKHGGNTPDHRLAAQREMAERAKRDVPYEELLKERDLGELMGTLKARSDITDITEELALARAVAIDYVNRANELETALLRWSGSFDPAYNELRRLHVQELQIARAEEDWERYEGLLRREPDPLDFVTRPKKVLDLANATRLLRDVVAIVDRIVAARTAGAIPVRDVETLLVEMTGVIERATREQIGDVTSRAALLTAIEHGFQSLRLGRGDEAYDGAPALSARAVN